MPCGMQIDQLIARMKASGVPGSAEAEKILDQLTCADAQEPTAAKGQQTPTEESGSERIST